MNIMDTHQPLLLPKIAQIPSEMGESTKLARLRRMLSMDQIAPRANLGRTTLWAIEKGSPKLVLGSYAQVLLVLGLENDLLKIAVDDVLGRKLEDAKLLVKKRAPKKTR